MPYRRRRLAIRPKFSADPSHRRARAAIAYEHGVWRRRFENPLRHRLAQWRNPASEGAFRGKADVWIAIIPHVMNPDSSCPNRHGRACHRKSGLPDLRHIISADLGQARGPMPSTTFFSETLKERSGWTATQDNFIHLRKPE